MLLVGFALIVRDRKTGAVLRQIFMRRKDV
jgi:hypothetical protein